VPPVGWVLRRGTVAPPQYGDFRAVSPENFSKMNAKIAYFSAFLQAEILSSAVASRHDWHSNNTKYLKKLQSLGPMKY